MRHHLFMEIPDRTGPVPDWHVAGAVKAGIRVHTENDKVYQKNVLNVVID